MGCMNYEYNTEYPFFGALIAQGLLTSRMSSQELQGFGGRLKYPSQPFILQTKQLFTLKGWPRFFRVVARAAWVPWQPTNPYSLGSKFRS